MAQQTNSSPTTTAHLIRSLSTIDLIFMGIGAIIGAGVFVLTGIAAATHSGPAIVISYLIAGTAALFAALAYAELAACIGGAGSAYNYAYAGFGQLTAWIIGWNILLEYFLVVSSVAIGWAGYVQDLLTALHLPLPKSLCNGPLNGGIINLLAFLIILILSLILNTGSQQSARFNTVIVIIKLLTIALFVWVATHHIHFSYWHPFMPFGWQGVSSGAALVFFAYIGFDALSTAVEETKSPAFSIPVSIISSLLICTLIYILVAGLLTLIVPYQTLNVSSPVAYALLLLKQTTAASFISAGAIAGLTTVMLVMYFGLTRIILAMARDHLLPLWLVKINPRTGSPSRIVYVTGPLMACIAGLIPIDRVAELVNIGTLSAYIFVCAGVIILRRTNPEWPRPFKLPFGASLPVLGILSCLYLMMNLPYVAWIRFFIWTVLGLAYYGYRRPKIRPRP